MITPDYIRTMARYNAWQNQSLFGAAAGLDAAARDMDRGAFFGSIRGTLSHLLWADLTWMSRFDGGEAPGAGIAGSADLFGWDEMLRLRPQVDARIAGWAWMVLEDDLAGEITWYSSVLGREASGALGFCAVHFFNHQTHHRGQVHAMLTAAGARPDATDLFVVPDDVPEWEIR